MSKEQVWTTERRAACDIEPTTRIQNWWFFLYSTSLFITLSDIFTWCIISIISILPVSDNSSASVSWSRTGRSPWHATRSSRFDSHLFIDWRHAKVLKLRRTSIGSPWLITTRPREKKEHNGTDRHSSNVTSITSTVVHFREPRDASWPRWRGRWGRDPRWDPSGSNATPSSPAELHGFHSQKFVECWSSLLDYLDHGNCASTATHVQLFCIQNLRPSSYTNGAGGSHLGWTRFQT